MSLLGRTIAAALLLATAGIASAATTADSYARHPDALAFAQQMEQKHGLAADQVMATLSRVGHDARVIRLISPPTQPGVRSWARYRERFVEPTRIERGLEFWAQNAATLHAASERYGVPEAIIVAIIGVETIYGRHTGSFTAAAALATLAFDYPPRAELFRHELEHLFLLAREQMREPLSYEGSYAGALGYPQFLPSSVRSYAVDFDADGRIDLEGSVADAIGSVASYLAAHGWQRGAPVAVRAHVEDAARAAPLIAAGIEPTLTEADFTAHGVLALDSVPPEATAALIDLETPQAATEYWLGFRNFYVITRYNRSSFYAMAVFALAEVLEGARPDRVRVAR